MFVTLLQKKTFLRKFGQVDRVVLSFILLIAVVAIISTNQALQGLEFTAASLLTILPFFLLSVFVASYAKATGLDQQIARVFSGRSGSTILAASLFGALSPFCSCGVIPITASLLRSRVPLAPVMAFWVASPLMDPEMFILTAAVLGSNFAAARTIAAIFVGLAAGFATLAISSKPAFADPLIFRQIGGCCNTGLQDKTIQWAFWRNKTRTKLFADEFMATGWFLLKWLVPAFFLESLMLAYLPAETIAQYLGSDHWWLLPGAAVLGVPSYLNGYAAIPVVSGLLDMGMTEPAGLTFMIAGGVTSIPAAMAVFPLVKRPVFVWYVGIGLVCALISGYAYQLALSF